MLTQQIQPAHTAAPVPGVWRGRRDETPRLLSWSARLLLMLIAFAGSAVYAVSYRLVASTIDLTSIAWAIGLAACTAWIGFGFLLLTFAEMRPKRFAGITILHWADVCLATMSVGMAIKMVGVAINLLLAGSTGGPVPLAAIAPIQLMLLITADIAMAVAFVRWSGRLGLPGRTAILLWVAALNGIFAAVLASLLVYGGFTP